MSSTHHVRIFKPFLYEVERISPRGVSLKWSSPRRHPLACEGPSTRPPETSSSSPSSKADSVYSRGRSGARDRHPPVGRRSMMVAQELGPNFRGRQLRDGHQTALVWAWKRPEAFSEAFVGLARNPNGSSWTLFSLALATTRNTCRITSHRGVHSASTWPKENFSVPAMPR